LAARQGPDGFRVVTGPLGAGKSVVADVLAGIVDAQLLGQILDQLRWNIDRVGQEHAQVPNGDHLDREPQPVVVPPPSSNQRPVLVVQVAVTLQLLPRQRREPPVAALIHHRDMKSPTAQRRSLFAA